MDKLKAMTTFVSIADEGSLTAAAEAMGASLPAVVRSLAALEEELDVRLFNRTTRRISLTDEGRTYLTSCRAVLAAVEEAESALTAKASEPRGHITMTAPVLFGQMYVAPAVTRFVQRYEKMTVSVLLLDRIVNLHEEGVDVGVRIGHLEDSSMVAWPVGTIRAVVAASPSYLRKHGTPTHPRQLLQRNCLRFSAASGPSWIFHEKGKAFTVPVTGNLDFNQGAAALDACVAGVGFGLFISYQVAPFLEDKRLRIVLEKFEPPPRPIHVVVPHARLLPSRTALFVEWMRRELRLVS